MKSEPVVGSDLPNDQEPLVERNGGKVEYGGEDSLREGGRDVTRATAQPPSHRMPRALQPAALTTALGSQDYHHHLRDTGKDIKTQRGSGPGLRSHSSFMTRPEVVSVQSNSASLVNSSPCVLGLGRLHTQVLKSLMYHTRRDCRAPTLGLKPSPT